MKPTVRDDAACSGCEIDRRAFLKEATLAAAALTGALAATAHDASALPVHTIEALAAARRQLTYPIPTADGVSIDRSNDTMVARYQGKLYVFARTCPHQNTALKWVDSDHRFQCPKHGSKYTADGIFIEGRATRSLDRFAIKRDANTVVVDLDQLFEEKKDAAAWQAAFIAL